MAQIIKHRRGSLERLSAVTSSLQKGEIVIASGSSNLTTTNGSSIVFAVVESGSIRAVNRVLRGTNAPNVFSGSVYNGMVDGVPYYSSGNSTLYLLGSDTNEAINLVGNIQPFSSSVSASIAQLSSSVGTTINTSLSALNTFSSSENNKSATLAIYTASIDTRLTEVGVVTGSLISSASAAKTTNDAQAVSITNLNTFHRSNGLHSLDFHLHFPDSSKPVLNQY